MTSEEVPFRYPGLPAHHVEPGTNSRNYETLSLTTSNTSRCTIAYTNAYTMLSCKLTMSNKMSNIKLDSD